MPLISEFTIGALAHCCFETDRFINASTHTHTPTQTRSSPNLPRSPAHQVELPAHSPALQLLPRRRLWDTKRQLWPILGFRRASDHRTRLWWRLDPAGGSSPVLDLTCVSTRHQHRCFFTPPSPGPADWSWTYTFDIIHFFYKVFYFSIWGLRRSKSRDYFYFNYSLTCYRIIKSMLLMFEMTVIKKRKTVYL